MKRLLLAALALLALSGCWDDSTSPPGTLTASFTVTGTQQVGQPVRFDASASTDPAGDGLTYTWSFGDGSHGGMRQIPHFFAQAGAYAVQLTVRDAQGATATATRTVEVAAAPPASGTAQVAGRVTLPDGTPLAGVSAQLAGSSATVVSGADGTLTLANVPAGVPVVVRLSRAGHLPGVVRMELPANAPSGYFRAVLVPRHPSVPLASAAAGGTVTGPDGTKVEFPAGAVVDAAGNPVAGSVDVSMTPIDLRTQAAAFPGEFAGVPAAGPKTPIASLGVVDVTLTSAGAPVRVAPGRMVTLEIPLYAGSATAGQTVPLWSLSEAAGTWVQEGEGTVVSSAASPTGLALRGEVAHFSPWNADVPFLPAFVQPRCVQALAGGGVTPYPGPCWVQVVPLSPNLPITAGAATIAAPWTTTLWVWPGATVRVDGFAFGNLYGQSAPVTVAAGATVVVDVVLSVVPAGPVDVVAGGDGLSPLWASSGGSVWLPRPPPSGWGPGTVNALASSGVLWVAAGSDSGGGVPLASSPDGLVWTPAPSAPFPIGTAVAWNGSGWLATGAVPGSVNGAVSTVVASSPNGLQWTAVATIPDFRANALAWNGSTWMMGGYLADQPNLPVQDVIYTSLNGSNWTPRASPFTSRWVAAIAWNGTEWMVGGSGNGGASLARSQNGATWTAVTNPLDLVYGLGWNGSYWVATGAPMNFGAAVVATSANGSTWMPQTSPLQYVPGVTWTGTMWVAVGGNGGAMTSPNGSTWTLSTAAFPAGTAVAARLPVFPPQ